MCDVLLEKHRDIYTQYLLSNEAHHKIESGSTIKLVNKAEGKAMETQGFVY
jgi:hypothetical protein